MVVRVTKPSFSVREKLKELQRPIGINGAALMATNTPQDAFSLIGARNRNRIINGDCRISQRGTSFSPPATGIQYNLDRFYTQSSSNNITITQSSDAPAGFSNSLLLTMGTATTLDYMRVGTSIEGYNLADLAFGTSSAKTFTLSFWVKCSLTGNFGVGFRNPTTSLDGTGTTTSRLASYSINSANTWEYKTITIPGPTSQTWGGTNGIGLDLKWDIGDSAARSAAVDTTWQTSNTNYPVGLTGGTKVGSTTGATWYITGVQLEEGKVATPFEYRHYGQELALCQRYYYKTKATTTGDDLAIGWCNTTTTALIGFYLPVTMRTTPSSLEVTGTAGDYSVRTAGGNITCSASPTAWNLNAVMATATLTVASGLTAGQGCSARPVNANAFFAWTAEL